jgi:hypothetical protein
LFSTAQCLDPCVCTLHALSKFRKEELSKLHVLSTVCLAFSWMQHSETHKNESLKEPRSGTRVWLAWQGSLLAPWSLPAGSMARTAGMERGTDSSCRGSGAAGCKGRKTSMRPPQLNPQSAPGEAQSRSPRAPRASETAAAADADADADADRADAGSNGSRTRSGPGGRYKRGQRVKHQPQLLTTQQETIIMLQCELEQAKWATLQARRFAAPPLAKPRKNEDVD